MRSLLFAFVFTSILAFLGFGTMTPVHADVCKGAIEKYLNSSMKAPPGGAVDDTAAAATQNPGTKTRKGKGAKAEPGTAEPAAVEPAGSGTVAENASTRKGSGRTKGKGKGQNEGIKAVAVDEPGPVAKNGAAPKPDPEPPVVDPVPADPVPGNPVPAEPPVVEPVPGGPVAGGPVPVEPPVIQPPKPNKVFTEMTGNTGKITAAAAKSEKHFVLPVPGARIGVWRDKFRKWLQYKLDHPYTVIAVDDLTPAKAQAIATDAFGLTAEKGASLISITEVKAEMQALLKSVRTYPGGVQKFTNECATMQAQIETLEKALKNLKRTANIDDVHLPEIRMGKGKPRVWPKEPPEFYPSRLQMELDLKELKRNLRHKTGFSPFRMNEAMEKGFAQIVNVKRLETYRAELLRLGRKHGFKVPDDLPGDLKQFVKEVESLYKNPANPTELIDKYKAPAKAMSRLKTKQLTGELKSIIFKEFPKKLEDLEGKPIFQRLKIWTGLEKTDPSSLIQYVRQLNPQEARAIGLGHLATSASIWSQTKWANFIIATGSTGTVGTASWVYILKPLYDLWRGDDVAKQECAEKGAAQPGMSQMMPSEVEMLVSECLDQYLVKKFPRKYISAYANKRSLLDPNQNTIKDPEILAEMKDVQRRYREHQYYENVKADMRAATQTTFHKLNKGSVEALLRTAVMTTDEAEFKKNAVNYLYAKHPVALREEQVEARSLVHAILESQPGPGQQELFTKLQAVSRVVSDNLWDLLNWHANPSTFDPTGTSPPGYGGYPDYSGNSWPPSDTGNTWPPSDSGSGYPGSAHPSGNSGPSYPGPGAPADPGLPGSGPGSGTIPVPPADDGRRTPSRPGYPQDRRGSAPPGGGFYPR